MLLGLLLLCFTLPKENCAQENFSVRGYYKVFSFASDLKNSSSLHGSMINRVGGNLLWKPVDSGLVEMSYEILPTILSSGISVSQFLSNIESPTYRVFDIKPALYDGTNGFAVRQNLNRLYTSWRVGAFDLSIGRQPIAFGSARSVNPTDVFSPVSLQELDQEQRVGVDAFSGKMTLGELSEFQFGSVFGENFSMGDGGYFFRLRTNFWKSDFSTLMISFQRNLLFGVDLATSLGQLGVWMESAYVIPSSSGERGYFRSSIGMDTSLTEKIYTFLEFHWNGAGTSDSNLYSSVVTKSAYQTGAVYLLGEMYSSLGLSLQLSPLWQGQTSLTANLSDWSSLLSLSFERSLADEMTIGVGAFLSLGPANESEFSFYPHSYFTTLRVYF